MDKLLHFLLLVALFSVGRAANCGLPGLPIGGLINRNSDWPDDVNFSPGTQVRYTCAGEGQIMFDENVRKCTPDGRWTGSPPLCLTNVVLKRPVTVEIHSSHNNRPAIYDIPELTDGLTEVMDTHNCFSVSSNEWIGFILHALGDYVVHQLWIHTNKPFLLNNNFNLSIPQNWTREVTTNTPTPSIVVKNNNMQVVDELSVGILSSSPMAVCEFELYAHRIENGCGRPDAPANGRVSVETNVAIYNCDIGYQIDGPTQRTCTGLRWNKKVPLCIAHEPIGPTVKVVRVEDSNPINKRFPDQEVTNEEAHINQVGGALVISLLVVLLIILLAALGFCIYFSLKMKKKPEHVYEVLFKL